MFRRNLDFLLFLFDLFLDLRSGLPASGGPCRSVEAASRPRLSSDSIVIVATTVKSSFPLPDWSAALSRSLRPAKAKRPKRRRVRQKRQMRLQLEPSSLRGPG